MDKLGKLLDEFENLDLNPKLKYEASQAHKNLSQNSPP